ncbi:unnamed protein product, partial [Nesidiocoris tenuis]
MFSRNIGIIVMLAAFSSASSSSSSDCKLYNTEIDALVQSTNIAINTSHRGAAVFPGFEESVHISIYGMAIPITISLKAQNGLVGTLNSMSRSGDFFNCKHSDGISVEGVLKYDELTSTYDKMTVKFLFWEAEGRFIFKTEPSFNVYLTSSDIDKRCGIQTLNLASSGNMDYQFVTTSWTGWFLERIVHSTLVYGDSTPLLSNVANI